MMHPRPLSPSFHVLEPSSYAIFFLSFIFFPFLYHVLSFSSCQIHLSIFLSQSPSLTPTSLRSRFLLSATHHQLHLSFPRDLSLSLHFLSLFSLWLCLASFLVARSWFWPSKANHSLRWAINFKLVFVFFLFQEESKMFLQWLFF